MALRSTFLVLGISWLALATPTSHASLILYNSQAAFLAAVSNPGTDNFDDLPLASISPVLNRIAGPYSYLASSFRPNNSVDPFYPGGSISDVWLSTNNADARIVFTNFSAGVVGIGGFFFGSDVLGEFLPGQSMTFTAVDGNDTEVATLTNTNVGSFLGFVSDGSLTSLSVAAVQGNDLVWPTVNDLILAQQHTQGPTIPEPASLALLGLGLAALGYSRRKSRVRRASA